MGLDSFFTVSRFCRADAPRPSTVKTFPRSARWRTRCTRTARGFRPVLHLLRLDDSMGAQWPCLYPLGATYQRFDPHDTVRELSVDDIRELIAIYGECARNLKEVGYDGIQIHATHAMLPTVPVALLQQTHRPLRG